MHLQNPTTESADTGSTRPCLESMRSRVADLCAIKRSAVVGDEVATQSQRAKGKLTARERLAKLLDRDSVTEIETLRRHRTTDFGMSTRRPRTDGVIAGWGRIAGRPVTLYARAFRTLGGALGEAHADKIHQAMDMAERCGVPLTALCDGSGAREPTTMTAARAGRPVSRREGAQ